MSKKQISIYKFIRVANDPHSVQVKGFNREPSFTVPFYFALNQALEAYVLNGHIYMWQYSRKNRRSYIFRYELDSKKAREDWVAIGGRV